VKFYQPFHVQFYFSKLRFPASRSYDKVVDLFVEWKEYNPEDYVDELLKVAGTSDLIADYNGELAVIDWKTGSYIKKDEYVFNYILQGTAYCHMLAEMYKLVPKKIVICTLIRFSDPKKPVPFMDGDKVVDLLVEWKEYNPEDYVDELLKVCKAYHFSKSG
jgi:hypothetical protein